MTRAPARVLALVPAIVLLGLVAEWVMYGPDAPRIGRREDLPLALVDLLTGWTVAAAGLVAWAMQRSNRVGPLLVASGVAWFLGNFGVSDIATLAALATWLELVYRAPIVHAVVTFPSGRPRGVAQAFGVAVAWVVSLVPVLWEDRTVSLVLGLLLVALVWSGQGRARGGRERDLARTRRAAGLLLGLAFALPAVFFMLDRPYLGGGGWILFQAAYVMSAVALATVLVRRDRRADRLTHVVVELGAGSALSLRDTLARLLDDPRLAVGTWDPDHGDYRDGAGGVVDTRPTDGRAATLVPSGDGPGAILIHDAGLIEDRGLADAVAAATRLQATHEALRRMLRSHAEELARSRDRLLAAAAEERRRLGDQLEGGAARRITEIRGQLRAVDATAEAGGQAATVDAIGIAMAQVEGALEDLDALARGLRPRGLYGGLDAALRAVVTRADVPVELRLDVPTLPPALEETAWFVCAEAIANAQRHASAGIIVVSVGPDACDLVIRVEDDGVGGVDSSVGSGLQGLRSRVEAAGGRLTVHSPRLGGTRIEARLPRGIVASHRSEVVDPPAGTDVPPAARAYGEAPS